MATTTKFSEFTSDAELQVGDIVVGLRDGSNGQFTFPATGIKDADGNYLVKWTSVGATATNYLTFTSSVSGDPVILSCDGSDANIDLKIQSNQEGDIYLSPGESAIGKVIADCTTSIKLATGTTGERPTGTAGEFRFNTTLNEPEYINNAASWTPFSSSFAPTTLTYITQDDETSTLPNSIPLSGIGTGILANTTGTGDLTPRTLTGTSNQVTVTNGDGSADPTFSIPSTFIAPGSIEATTSVTAGTNLDVGAQIRHIGNTDNRIVFSTDTQTYELSGSEIYQITTSGMRLGGANARVTTILDEDNMASDSATALATQQSIKAYVDGSGSTISNYTYITKTDDTTYLPNSVPLSALSTGMLGVETSTGTLSSVTLTGTTNEIDIANGDGSGTPTFSLPSTMIAPGSLEVTTNLALNGSLYDPLNGTSTSISFGSNTIYLTSDSSTKVDINPSGIRFGGSGSRVTTILNEDGMGSDSDTALATQQSIKAYVDNTASDIVSYDYITQTDNTADLPNSVALSDLSSGILAVETGTGALSSVTLTGTTNEIDISNGDGGGTPTFSLPSTMITPGTLESTSTLTAGGTIFALGNITITGLIQPSGVAANSCTYQPGSQTHTFRTGATTRLDISNSGTRLGGANARVTTILDEDDMASDSATALATQQSIKAYVDTNAGGERKNIIIGGDFTLNPWQRGTSFVSVADTDYTADRFYYEIIGSSAVNDIDKTADAPTVAEAEYFTRHCLEFTVTTADATVNPADFTAIGYVVEGYDYGLIAQQACTLSFWVKSNLTGTFCISLINDGNDRSYVSEYTIDTADTWEKKTINITAFPSAGTWNYTNDVGLRIFWTLACGTTYQTGTTDTWQSANYYGTSSQANANSSTSNYFRLALPQIEKGDYATSFELRRLQEELELCERYYRKTFEYGVAPVQNVGNVRNCIRYRSQIASTTAGYGVNYAYKTMRDTPTIVFYNPQNTNANWYNINGAADSGAASANGTGDSATQITNVQAAGDGVGENMAVHATFDAEL